MNELTNIVQERLIALYLWGENPRLVRALTPPAVFDPYWKDLAQAAVDYLDAHGTSPGEHASAVVETVIARNDPKKGPTFVRLWESLREKKADFDPAYVLEKARKFARFQRMNSGITAALGHMEAGRVDEAEAALTTSLRVEADLFDPGTVFTDKRAMAFLDDEDECEFPQGIPVFDDRNLSPRRGTLWLVAAFAKLGKSWCLLNLAKRSILAKKTVVYVTLEMSEKVICGRLFQSFFALTKRQQEDLKRVKFTIEPETGRWTSLEVIPMGRHTSFADENARKLLTDFQKRLTRRPKLVVKQFPTGDLTLKQLEGYLDLLEARGIGPDLLIVDYADLMCVDVDNLRVSTQAIYRGLRGLAVRRNIAVATASQTNRGSAHIGKTDVHHLAEDIGKAAIVDVLYTLSRTDFEKDRGLMRMMVAAGREDADRLTVVLSQNLAIGQFVMDSALMSSAYDSYINPKEDEDEEGN